MQKSVSHNALNCIRSLFLSSQLSPFLSSYPSLSLSLSLFQSPPSSFCRGVLASLITCDVGEACLSIAAVTCHWVLTRIDSTAAMKGEPSATSHPVSSCLFPQLLPAILSSSCSSSSSSASSAPPSLSPSFSLHLHQKCASIARPLGIN